MPYICTISYFDYNHCPESRFMLCLFWFLLQSITRRQRNGDASFTGLWKTIKAYVTSDLPCLPRLFVIIWLGSCFLLRPFSHLINLEGKMVWTISFQKIKKVKAKSLLLSAFHTLSWGIKVWYLVPGSQTVSIRNGTKQGSSCLKMTFLEFPSGLMG